MLGNNYKIDMMFTIGMGWATTANRVCLFILSLIVFGKRGILYAAAIFFGTRAIQYAFNFLAVNLYTYYLMRAERLNPMTYRLKIVAVMVISELAVLAAVTYATRLMLVGNTWIFSSI